LESGVSVGVDRDMRICQTEYAQKIGGDWAGCLVDVGGAGVEVLAVDRERWRVGR
jgi:hypothetical protein